MSALDQIEQLQAVIGKQSSLLELLGNTIKTMQENDKMTFDCIQALATKIAVLEARA